MLRGSWEPVPAPNKDDTPTARMHGGQLAHPWNARLDLPLLLTFGRKSKDATWCEAQVCRLSQSSEGTRL